MARAAVRAVARVVAKGGGGKGAVVRAVAISGGGMGHGGGNQGGGGGWGGGGNWWRLAGQGLAGGGNPKAVAASPGGAPPGAPGGGTRRLPRFPGWELHPRGQLPLRSLGGGRRGAWVVCAEPVLSLALCEVPSLAVLACVSCSGGREGENGTRGAVLCSTPHNVDVQRCATLTNPTHPINTIRTQACQSKLIIINALCWLVYISVHIINIICKCIIFADCIPCPCLVQLLDQIEWVEYS